MHPISYTRLMEGTHAFKPGIPNRRLVEDGSLSSAITFCVEDGTPMVFLGPHQIPDHPDLQVGDVADVYLYSNLRDDDSSTGSGEQFTGRRQRRIRSRERRRGALSASGSPSHPARCGNRRSPLQHMATPDRQSYADLPHRQCRQVHGSAQLISQHTKQSDISPTHSRASDAMAQLPHHICITRLQPSELH